MSGDVIVVFCKLWPRHDPAKTGNYLAALYKLLLCSRVLVWWGGVLGGCYGLRCGCGGLLCSVLQEIKNYNMKPYIRDMFTISQRNSHLMRTMQRQWRRTTAQNAMKVRWNHSLCDYLFKIICSCRFFLKVEISHKWEWVETALI